jgi:hypothetical protein
MTLPPEALHDLRRGFRLAGVAPPAVAQILSIIEAGHSTLESEGWEAERVVRLAMDLAGQLCERGLGRQYVAGVDATFWLMARRN